MKKFLLSTIVIVAFIVYALHLRTDDENQVNIVLAKPTLVPDTATPSPTIPVSTTPGLTASPTQVIIPTSTPKPLSPYRDGTYVGNSADAFYGFIQVQATISNGRITDIQFLQYPNDRGTSVEINRQADPMLAQEAIAAQSAQVDIISGATDSSKAFSESLQTALNKAKG